ncbi:hypothetical protein TRFO_21475 [Tritrichomonas foetus]|uniref:Calcineurin-like phosphoesterase domain-containing protein n=1 Tax=Tritrichomonas foetus TaxID=1144522 RepID=A0A1J4KIT3_9EUKA|nr:hypothetical protein TRFO_21475 [Tritrichomonas foetus]|eukprot:OHT09590.1 hypothetical protein TRFO_21475 [Tritrichomonas foetus]
MTLENGYFIFGMCSPTYFEVHIDDFETFKGLIVADFHIGCILEREESEKKIFENLQLLVEKVQPTHIFILGDIFHYNFAREDDWYFNFFDSLAQLFTCPIFIIPGNHDYTLFPVQENCFTQYKKDNNIYPIDVDLLEIQFSNEFSLFLGHDIRYNQFVHFHEFVVKWMNEIRQYCKDRMKNSDVLIIGHTHEDIDDEETNNYTLGPFSCDLKESSYGIITFNPEFKFQHEINFISNITLE